MKRIIIELITKSIPAPITKRLTNDGCVIGSRVSLYLFRKRLTQRGKFGGVESFDTRHMIQLCIFKSFCISIMTRVRIFTSSGRRTYSQSAHIQVSRLTSRSTRRIFMLFRTKVRKKLTFQSKYLLLIICDFVKQ